jgi:sirohydrochlorin cobaltochelatase
VPTPTAIVIVAHGSRAAAANDAHHALCDELAERTGRTIVPAFLEIAEPNIPDALAAALADGHREVAVLPHFLAPGNHTTRDIPALVEAARAAHPESSFDILPHTGADPGLVTLIAASLDGLDR